MTISVTASILTPSAFEPYGTIVSPSHLTSSAVGANQGTAQKFIGVSSAEQTYASAPSGQPSVTNWNLFRCNSPSHLIESLGVGEGEYLYNSKVLEKHPFSSQTFLPLGEDSDKIRYLVIVAHEDPASKILYLFSKVCKQFN